MSKKHIKWTTLGTVNVDIHTGEILTKYQTRNYIKHKTIKNAYTRPIALDRPKDGYRGYIEYTIEWRRNPQTNLFDTKKTN